MKLFRRAAALLLMAALLLIPVRAADTAFRDVPERHWAYESVQKAAQYGLAGGVGGGNFGVGQKVTRAQYAKMLCSLMGWSMSAPETGSFADNQDKTKWYYAVMETAYDRGVLLKLGEDCKPNEPLPREELAAMTMRALDYAPLAGVVQDDCPFTDVTTNRGYIALAYRMGVLSGVGGDRFEPRTIATREQAAAVLVRVYDRLHDTQRTAVHSGETVPENAVWAESGSNSAASIPMYPRAPLESVYDAAVKAGAGGAVALHTAPVLVTTRGNMASQPREITDAELQRYLDSGDTKTYRSTRYESSYLTSGSTVVWYESGEDVAEKVQLCRMLGVGSVYLAK